MKSSQILSYLKDADESDFRLISVQNYLRNDWKKRWAYSGLSRVQNIFLIRWILTFVSFFSVIGINYQNSAQNCLIAYPKYSNERRSLKNSLLKHPVLKYRIKLVISGFYFKSLFALTDLYRSARPFDSIHLFVNIRQIQCLAYYYIYKRLFHLNTCGVIITSTTNPHGLALYQWAKDLNIKTINITHGHPARAHPPLEFDQIIYNSRLHFNKMGGRGIIIKSKTSPQHFPETISTVGIFLNKCPNLKKISKIIASNLFENIIVRVHPSSLITINKKSQFSNQSLDDDIECCDLIFAGNSSVHLDIIRGGKLSLYDPTLDSYPYDLYGFVEKGIVEQVEINHLDDFYQRRAMIFEKYKKSYDMLTNGNFVDNNELGQIILDMIT